MELRHLRYFVAVAEERHFGRAAKRLHIAQPSLSRQIRDLESELGFPVFERSRRRVDITTAGAVLLEHARRVFASVDIAVNEARRANLGETGRIAVGYASSLAYSGITGLLRSFRARAPSIEISLAELPPQQQIVRLKGATIDVGFVRGPLDEPALSAERVRREPLVAAVPEGHRLARRRIIHIADLAQEPFVIFPRERGPAFFDHIVGLCRAAGFLPRIVQEAPFLDVVTLVAAGFGVSIVPATLRSVTREGLAVVSLHGAPTTDLFVVWRAGNNAPAVRAFLDHVRTVGVHARVPRRGPRRAQ